MAYLLARVENFTRFDGEALSAQPVMGYGKSGETPHEQYNFRVASDGFVYGYLPKEGGGDLTRLGAKKGDEDVGNVTVIFLSSGVLCGYYRNATVFASPKRHPDLLMAGTSEIFCRVRVDPKDAYLVPATKRFDEVTPRPKGQFPVLYGDEGSEWISWFEGLKKSKKASDISEKKRKKWTQQVERSSKARSAAINHYGYKCGCCGLAHEDAVRSAIFEVHHKSPYAEDFGTRKVKLTDLAVLCANCHRMIHQMPDLSDINGLREILKSN